MEEEIERLRTLLGFHYFLQERIYRESNQGLISGKNIVIILRRNHNIPKIECSVIVKGLEILGLIKNQGNLYIVKNPKKSQEELVLEFKKKMGMV